MPNPKMLQDQTSTISEYVSNTKNETFVNSAFYLQQLIMSTNSKGSEGFIMNLSSLINKYKPEFDQLIVSLKLSNIEHKAYRYNPKKLSYKLYGTTELWQTILDLNGLMTALDFDLTVVRMYDTTIFEKLNRVISIEKDILDYNRASLVP